MAQRKRYVLAGTGSRGISMFAQPILREYQRYCDLVALFDHNPLRLKAANELLGTQLPVYTNFQKMLSEVNPDAVIITTRDDTHAQYIIKTLKAGKRAVSEKPLCVTGKQCRDIYKAERENRRRGARCLVTHNMRYGPAMLKLKELMKDGAIGELKSFNFHENLDRRHGADYFRRWHRIKANSGGLLIHKSSHHFDYMNWLVGSKPDTLVAQGGLLYYGKNGPFRHKRCMGCPKAKQCDFYIDFFKNDRATKMYKNAESHDGYLRDACVFDRKIDIEDQATVAYSYANGVQATYSLTAFASYEGMQLFLEGTKGRIEYKSISNTDWTGGNNTVFGLDTLKRQEFILFRPKHGVEHITYKRVKGEHGGADPQIRDDFFGRPFNAKLTPRQAPLEEALQAVLVGHAANVSIANNSRTVRVQDFMKRG